MWERSPPPLFLWHPLFWSVWKTQNYSKYTVAKSQQTGIRLRKVVSGPTPHLLQLCKESSPTLFNQQNKEKDQFWLSSPTGKTGPTQELPNQLVLQTGHRNTLAKSVPWTPNATNCCKWTCCSDLPIWQTLYQPGMVLLPRWITEPKDSPKQSPTRIYKTAAKEVMTKIPGQHTWLAI